MSNDSETATKVIARVDTNSLAACYDWPPLLSDWLWVLQGCLFAAQAAASRLAWSRSLRKRSAKALYGSADWLAEIKG